MSDDSYGLDSNHSTPNSPPKTMSRFEQMRANRGRIPPLPPHNKFVHPLTLKKAFPGERRFYSTNPFVEKTTNEKNLRPSLNSVSMLPNGEELECLSKSHKLREYLIRTGKSLVDFVHDFIMKATNRTRPYRQYKPGEEERAAGKKTGLVVPANDSLISTYFNEPWMCDGTVYAVTLASNCSNLAWFHHAEDRKKARMERAFNRMDRDIQKGLLGRHFNKPHNYERRWEGVFLFERPSGNIHLHGVMDAKGKTVAETQRLLTPQWKTHMPSGTVKVVPIEDMYGWISYMTKYYREHGNRSIQGDDLLYMPAVPKRLKQLA